MDVLHDVLLETVPLAAVFGTAAIGSFTACITCKVHDRKIARQKAMAKAKAARIRAMKRAKAEEIRRRREWKADWIAFLNSEAAEMKKEQTT